jgi:hypothetical protein
MGEGLRVQPTGHLVPEAAEVVLRREAVHTLAVGDRIAVFSAVNGTGIGVVSDIIGDDMFYTMFNANVVYRKPVKAIQWNDKNWWETSGLGAMRKPGPGGDRCRS